MGSLSNQSGSWAGTGVRLGETYLLGRRINRGGMGEVFEATHARLPGRFAVKILRPDLLANREAFARFCREAEVMSELRHPNVVQIFDFNTTPDGRPYFVMEHLEGRDLEARLAQSGPLTLPAAVRVVDAVCSALATAHAHGIIHRDLKPANIFLVAIDGQMDEVVKVLDFGISKVRAAGTLLSSPTDMLGSPAYMSPEQARGAAEEVDGRSDQFALGAITYRMLTGVEPFSGNDIASLLYQVVHEDAPGLAQHLPGWWDTRALQAVLDRALAKTPAQRFGGMMEMARAFEAASEQTLSHAPPEQPDRGTVNLGATLIAAPPPPPLRPARMPAAAPGARTAVAPELEDSAPPIRLPTPGPALRPIARLPAGASDFDVADPLTDDDRASARDETFDSPYGRDELPINHHRLAIAGIVGLAIVAVLGVTGLYRRIVPGVRHELGLARRTPATSPPTSQPEAPPANTEAPRATATPPPAPAAEAPARAKPASAAKPPETPTGPAKPAAAEAHATPTRSHRHHMEPEPRLIERPGSIYLSPRSPSASPASRPDEGPSERFNPFMQPAPPTIPSAPPSPPATNRFAPPPPATAPDTVPNQFSIPPPRPTEDSPAHDLAPPSVPEREPSPGPAITPAPRPRNPSDDPLAPSF